MNRYLPMPAFKELKIGDIFLNREDEEAKVIDIRFWHFTVQYNNGAILHFIKERSHNREYWLGSMPSRHDLIEYLGREK